MGQSRNLLPVAQPLACQEAPLLKTMMHLQGLKQETKLGD